MSAFESIKQGLTEALALRKVAKRVPSSTMWKCLLSMWQPSVPAPACPVVPLPAALGLQKARC
jgi:hypothetical protein